MLLLPVTLFLRMALNAIDGMLARGHHQQSRLGALINELGDLVSDMALYLPLALIPGMTPIAMLAAVLAAVLAEYTGVCAALIGSERRYDGPMDCRRLMIRIKSSSPRRARRSTKENRIVQK